MIEIKEYSTKTEIPERELFGRSRIPDITLAREAYWIYLNKIQKISMKQIGKEFGRNQSTISSGIKTIRELGEVRYSKIKKYINILKISDDFFITRKK